MLRCLTIALLAIISVDAQAVPSFASQTGLECGSCHTVFPELTALGRSFKLNAYTMSGNDKSPAIPVAASLQVSRTSTRDTDTSGAMPSDFPKDSDIIVQLAGLYYAGKITDKSGAFVNVVSEYDGANQKRETQLEMTDIRFADATTVNGKNLVYGVTLNNDPTVQDVWNSTPTFSFPYASSNVAPMPMASPLLDMGLSSQVGGLGAYALWNDLLYAELSIYRTADSGIMRPLGAGADITSVVKGNAPYWRLALQREDGTHSFAVGTFGLSADIYPDSENKSGATDNFKDIGVDAQYQYLGGDHVFTSRASWIREKQTWDARFPAMQTDNPSDTLKAAKLSASYFYRRQVGGTLGYFATTGDTDAMLYGMGAMTPVMGNMAGRPDTRGYVVEVNYLPRQNVKLAMQYTAYSKFNGASKNYDGFGRDAADNNTVYLLGWLMF
ncbi:MAG: hypothetical protein AB1810_08360 [Pseudomonadota bacterium]